MHTLPAPQSDITREETDKQTLKKMVVQNTKER